MQQMPFDFDQTAQKDPEIISVSDLNKMVRGQLETRFNLIWVKGEISNFKAHTSGHFYFSLKDSKAQVSAVMFKGFNQGLKFRPTDGLEVIVRGKITVYEPRGSYQVFCELMEPVGAGALQLAFEQLKKKLEAEGLFAAEKKRALPPLPKHVAIVTSPTGAAIRDILNILSRRFKGLRVTVVPALVQGAGAAPSIIEALQKAQMLPDIDVMIVGRGGGSIEDMWCFNDEGVARAIAACRVPIISAVGHEIDFTIADFVADLRAPTPSAAAELVVRNTAELVDNLKSLRLRLWKSFSHTMQMKKQSMHHLSQRLVDPKRYLQEMMQRCDELTFRLENGLKNVMTQKQQKVLLFLSRLGSPAEQLKVRHQALEKSYDKLVMLMKAQFQKQKYRVECSISLLDTLSPLKVVARGYAVVRQAQGNINATGEVIRSTKQVKVNDQLSVQLAEGKLNVEVKSLEN